MPTYVYQQTWDVDTGSPDGTGGTVTRVTTPTHDGAGALRIVAAADVGYWLKNASSQIIVMHIWMQFTTLPSVTTADMFGIWVPGTGFFGLGYDKTANQFFCEIQPAASAAPGGPVLTTGQWYSLNVKIDIHLATVTVDANVDDTALAQNSTTGGPFTCDSYRLGEFQASQSYDLYLDTFDVSHTAADYPLYTSTIYPSVAWWGAAG